MLFPVANDSLSVVLGAYRAVATRRALGTLRRLSVPVDVAVVVENSTRDELRGALYEETWDKGRWTVIEDDWGAAAAWAASDVVVLATDDGDWTKAGVAAWRWYEGECFVEIDDRERFGRTAGRLYPGGVVASGEVAASLSGTRVEFMSRLEAACKTRSPKRRRRLKQETKKFGPFADAYYDQPMSDASDATSTTLALALGYEPVASRTEAAVGLNSRGTLSRAQALCLLAGLKVAMLGDSITRFHYFVLNEFLQLGELESHIDDIGASGVPGFHYDRRLTWTKEPAMKKHRQHYAKTIALNSTSTRGLCPDKDGMTVELKYWFLIDWETIQADALRLFAGALRVWAPEVVYFNMGLWELKDVSGQAANEPHDATGVRRAYATHLAEAFDGLVAKVQAGYFRNTPCCGEQSTEPKDIPDDERIRQSALGVWALNDVAGRLVRNKYNGTVRTVDIWPLITPLNSDKHDRTADGIHPVAPIYHMWTHLFLWAIASDDRLYPVDNATGLRASDFYVTPTCTRGPMPRRGYHSGASAPKGGLRGSPLSASEHTASALYLR